MLHISLLQADASPQGSWYSTPILIVLMVFVMYFFMLRPQQKRQREQRNFVKGIKEGDHIVTNGGIHAKVVSLEQEETISLEIGKGTKVLLDRASISYELTKRHYKK